MMENVYLPDDPRLIENIVCEVKSQGLFDQFRRECMADVDTKPAYQNLRQRVDTSVAGFLNQQDWRPDLNRNQLREKLRKHITESGFLETGVDRIVDQVVNPKISTVFLPKIEDVVYKYLGIEKPEKSISNDIKLFDTNGLLEIKTDLMPTDLEAVSPDSDKKSISQLSDVFNEANDSNDGINDSTEKIEEFESPAFEPLEGRPPSSIKKDESNDSRLSGISGLTSQDSIGGSDNEDTTNMKSSIEKLEESVVIENIKPNSQLSQVSSNSHLSIETGSDRGKTSGVDISEEAQMPEFNDDNYSTNTKTEQLTFDNIKKDEIQFEGTERKSLIKADEYDDIMYGNEDIKEETTVNTEIDINDMEIKEESGLEAVIETDQLKIVGERIVETVETNNGWLNESNTSLNNYAIMQENSSINDDDSSNSSNGLVIYGYSESVSQSSDLNMKDDVNMNDKVNKLDDVHMKDEVNNQDIVHVKNEVNNQDDVHVKDEVNNQDDVTVKNDVNMKTENNSEIIIKQEDNDLKAQDIKVDENDIKLSQDVKQECIEIVEESNENKLDTQITSEIPVKHEEIKIENEKNVQNMEIATNNDLEPNKVDTNENTKNEMKAIALIPELIKKLEEKTGDDKKVKLKDEKSSKDGYHKSSSSSHSSKHYSRSGSSSSKSQSHSSKTSRSSSSSSRHTSKEKHHSEKSRSFSSKSSSSSRDSSSKFVEKYTENYHLNKSSSSHIKRSDSSSKDIDKYDKRSHSSCSSSTRDKEKYKDRERDRNRDRDRKSTSGSQKKTSSLSPSTKEKKKEKLVDDHFSSRDKTCEKRRSTDRDSNDGTGNMGNNNNTNNTQRGNNLSSNSSTSSRISCDVENNNSTTSPSNSSPTSCDVLTAPSSVVSADSVIILSSDTASSSNTSSCIIFPSTSNDNLSDIVIPQIQPPIIVDQMLTPNDNANMDLLINHSKQLISKNNDNDNKMDNAINNNNNNNSSLINNNLTIKKKPKFASNFYEARKLMKVRKKMEREEKKNIEKMIVNAKKDNPNNYEINKHGPEIEFSCDQGMKPFISNYQNKNCNNNLPISMNNYEDNERDLLYFPEPINNANEINYPESYSFIGKLPELVTSVKTHYNNTSHYLFKVDNDFESAFSQLLNDYKKIDEHNNIIQVKKRSNERDVNVSVDNTEDTDTNDTVYDIRFDDLDDNDVNDIVDDDINCDLDDDNLMLNDFIDDIPQKRKHDDGFTISNNNNNNNETTLNVIKKMKMIGDEDINKSSPTPSDQSTSSKENTFIGKARRVGLPKIRKSVSTPVSLTSHNAGVRVALGLPVVVVDTKKTPKPSISTVTATVPTTKRELSFENLRSTSTTNQRYSSDDLYKPRPFVSKSRTRRNRGQDETTTTTVLEASSPTTTTATAPSSTKLGDS